MDPSRLQADFNGLFGEMLCLSHTDTCRDESGTDVRLQAGMIVTVVEHDLDPSGNRDDLVATGTVEASPEWLACRGSRWVLRIDGDGVRNESKIPH